MKNFAGRIVLAIVVICSFQNVKGQTGFLLGTEAAMLTGGDGFGMFISPGLTVGYGKVAVTAGPLVQRSDMNLSGYHIKPTFALSDSGYRKVRIYLFTQAMYNTDVHLSKTYQQILTRVEPEMMGKEDMRFRTYQQYAGIGVSGDNSKRVVLRTEIGVGGYLNLKHKNPVKVPGSFQGTRSNSDISVMFSMGLRVNLIKQ